MNEKNWGTPTSTSLLFVIGLYNLSIQLDGSTNKSM